MWIKTQGSHFNAAYLPKSYGLLNLETGAVIQIDEHNPYDDPEHFFTVEYYPDFKLPIAIDKTKTGGYEVCDDGLISDFNVVTLKCFDTFDQAKLFLDKLAQMLSAQDIF